MGKVADPCNSQCLYNDKQLQLDPDTVQENVGCSVLQFLHSSFKFCTFRCRTTNVALLGAMFFWLVTGHLVHYTRSKREDAATTWTTCTHCMVLPPAPTTDPPPALPTAPPTTPPTALPPAPPPAQPPPRLQGKVNLLGLGTIRLLHSWR